MGRAARDLCRQAGLRVQHQCTLDRFVLIWRQVTGSRVQGLQGFVLTCEPCTRGLLCAGCEAVPAAALLRRSRRPVSTSTAHSSHVSSAAARKPLTTCINTLS